MNAQTPTKVLRVAEQVSTDSDPVAVLGRDIRISSEKIANYCVTDHEPVYEDLVTLVESMAYWDRRIARRRTGGWTRELPIQIPAFEHAQFQRTAVLEALADAALFLTGDQWSFDFTARKRAPPSRQGAFPLSSGTIRHVIPFSDGLDSFAQVQLSVREHGRDAVLLVRAGLSRDRTFPKLRRLRVPRKFHGVRLREVSYRTRPLVFYTLAAISALMTGADAVVIGESGQGAIGPACLPFADEWWFRSAHPAFVERWSNFLRLVLGRPIRFEQPQLWKTKGEVLANLRAEGLLAGWEWTSSCCTRPNDRHGHQGCGICGGCLLRTVSAHSADIAVPAEVNAFNVYAPEDVVRHRNGQEKPMASSDRAVAVRAIAAMADFARLVDSPDGALAVQREAQLIGPTNPEATQTKLLRLLERHRAEWRAFVDSLPERSWVRDIVGKL
jgi:7-cyano-7-deazaguanine synthase in queuosine biosynthesis